MNRFFLTSRHIRDKKVVFPDDIAHQIRHVLRLGPGDLVEVLDNSGKMYRVQIDSETDQPALTGTVLDIVEEGTEPAVFISLYFGLTGREKTEWILQKGTEVGVSVFQPFISERTLTQSPDLSLRKVERWERIIREAAEQSHRSRLPVLEQPHPLPECFRSAKQENGLNLLAWEEADVEGQNLNEALGLYRSDRIGCFIGPEGGFSRKEAEQGSSYGCRIVSLGNRILRMETAAILFPALVLFRLNAL
jgi:16S rRNA (uracil1498-N3)-methyltransferase